MRIPFPFPLHVGTDIIQTSRLSKPQNHLRKLVLRILQPTEQQTLNDRFPHWSEEALPNGGIREWIGGRWAAKEAAKKAWGASLLSFRDLRVEMGDDGELQVICVLLDGDKPSLAFDEQAAKLSISHDGRYAIATVIASPLQEKIVAELRRRKAEAEKHVTQHTSESSSLDDVDL